MTPITLADIHTAFSAFTTDSQVESVVVDLHDPEDRTFWGQLNYLDGSKQDFEFYYGVGLTGEIRTIGYCEPEDEPDFDSGDDYPDDGEPYYGDNYMDDEDALAS